MYVKKKGKKKLAWALIQQSTWLVGTPFTVPGILFADANEPYPGNANEP